MLLQLQTDINLSYFRALTLSHGVGIPVADLLSVRSGLALVFGSQPAQPQPELEVLSNHTIGSSSGKWFEIIRA